MPPTLEQIAARLRETFRDAVLEVAGDGAVPFLRVEARSLGDMSHVLQTDAELAFDYLVFLTAVDYPADDKITLVYRFFSYKHGEALTLKADVPRAGGRAPTISHHFPAADWPEREVFDLFGVVFDGHPNLQRLLTAEGFVGHPLLKDFTSEDYVPFPESKL